MTGFYMRYNTGMKLVNGLVANVWNERKPNENRKTINQEKLAENNDILMKNRS